MKKILFTIVAAVLSTPVLAASLTYELRPDPFHMEEIVVWEAGGASTTTCDDTRIPTDFPGCSAEGYDLAVTGPIYYLPFITFEASLMPFDLAGNRVLLTSYPFYPGAGFHVFNAEGQIVFSYEIEDCCNLFSMEKIEWMPSFSSTIPNTEIDLTFDQAGAISKWRIVLDSDGGNSVIYSDGSASLREPGELYGIPGFDFRMSNDGGGEWLINGVPQEEFLSASTAVPLPASVLLLFGGLTALGGVRAGRRLRAV